MKRSELVEAHFCASRFSEMTKIEAGKLIAYNVMLAIEEEVARIDSRREQRRARKAKKNATMYKLLGHRPWRDSEQYDVLRLPARWRRNKVGHQVVMDHMREPSNFRVMDMYANYLERVRNFTYGEE
ncbi:MAG: hypothetical protein IPL79_20065 [Myxococcales bacterium]|nr:hypothetical protein [Myxococcales bacterium]